MKLCSVTLPPQLPVSLSPPVFLTEMSFEKDIKEVRDQQREERQPPWGESQDCRVRAGRRPSLGSKQTRPEAREVLYGIKRKEGRWEHG